MTMIRTLLEDVVDYAGLFPPAELALPQAVAAYEQERMGSLSWMLGRFVAPAAQLPELGRLVSERAPDQPWALSVVLADGSLAEVEQVLSHSDSGVRVEALEFPPMSAIEISRRDLAPECFFEIPLSGDIGERLAAISQSGGAAKVRTGGLHPSAFPHASALSGFLLACRDAGVAFKATAGLHYPHSGAHALDETGGAQVTMHGFLNLAVAASLIESGCHDETMITQLLASDSPLAFCWDGGHVQWNGVEVNEATARRTRGEFFRSFGSCSFVEPVEGLKELQLV